MSGPTQPARARPALSARPALWTGLAGIAVLVAGFGGWAAFSQLSGAVIASGQIVVDDNRQIIQHQDGGMVAEVLVRDAQPVAAGDLLVRLDGSSLRTELQIVEGQYFEVLSRIARFRAESADAAGLEFDPELLARATTDRIVAEQIAGQRLLFETRREARDRQIDQQRKRISQLRAQVDGLREQRVALQDQLVLLDKETADQRSLLEKGLAQQARVLALQRESIDVRGQIGALNAQGAAAGEQEAGIELEILGLGVARREEAAGQLQDLAQALMELSERRKELGAKIGRLEIRAPVGGIVLGLQATNRGAVLKPADPVLYLVPQDRPLLVAAQIPPLQVDEVHVGQTARVVLPGLPMRSAPDIWGHVKTISADTMRDQATNASYYRAEVEIDRVEGGDILDADGLPVRLMPGMPVETYIETGRRSPLAYLLKPFTDYFRKAFRES